MSRPRRKIVEAEPARPVEPEPPTEAIGTDTGLVDVKTRLPIHLHIPLVDAARRNQRSVAAEVRIAIREHLEREARS